jgi:hypothetical protein
MQVKWDVVGASYRSIYLQEYLHEGYEPFSVTAEKEITVVWLKKLIQIESEEAKSYDS